jgi:hypothetical protein
VARLLDGARQRLKVSLCPFMQRSLRFQLSASLAFPQLLLLPLLPVSDQQQLEKLIR